MRFTELGIFCALFCGVPFAAKVNEQLARIEATRAHLRGVHLNAHLEQSDLLNAAQIARYSQLRGYSMDHRGH